LVLSIRLCTTRKTKGLAKLTMSGNLKSRSAVYAGKLLGQKTIGPAQAGPGIKGDYVESDPHDALDVYDAIPIMIGKTVHAR
jgi:hypothetical protein